MLYKNMKVIVGSPDGNTVFFVAWVFQGDTFGPYLLIISQDYVLPSSIDLLKENGFVLKKTRSTQYPTETMSDISDVDYADDLPLLSNKPTSVDSLLHCLGLVVEGIDFNWMQIKQSLYILTKKELSSL